MLEYSRYKSAAAYLRSRLEAESGYRYRAAPLPPPLRRVSVDLAEPVYDPGRLSAAIESLLRAPPRLDLEHMARPHVSIDERLDHMRALLATQGSFSFDDAVQGTDRLTEAVTLFALLELYKAGEADWEQGEAFGPITVRAGDPLEKAARA